MQLVVQVIMVIVCIIIAFIVLYYCCKKLRHSEVTNVMKGNTVWAHFMATGYFPTNIHLSRPILKESVRIKTRCCIFK